MKILIVDDHSIVREGLAALLRTLPTGVTVLEAVDAADGLALAAANPDLDLVVLDLMLPGLSGLPALTEFGRRCPTLPVVVLSSSEDLNEIRQALAHGALGYVPKSASQRTLLAAIQIVMSGERYVPPLILNDGGWTKTRNRVPDARAEGIAGLTDRQIAVLRRLSEGEPNKVIARNLDIREKTVKAHVTSIFKALDVVNRTQAAAAARKAGLI